MKPAGRPLDIATGGSRAILRSESWELPAASRSSVVSKIPPARPRQNRAETAAATRAGQRRSLQCDEIAGCVALHCPVAKRADSKQNSLALLWLPRRKGRCC